MSLDTDLRRIARSLSSTLIAIRRDIHQHPEPANQETRTASKVVETLRGVGLTRIQERVGGTGVVALVTGGRGSGRAVALRADMDALPVMEKTGAPYASRNPGFMHACGHDGHTAMLLGAAMILQRLRARLNGTVKLVFQPAEESLLKSGAYAMIRAGALRNPAVRGIFALHVNPSFEFGTIALSSGPVLAAADIFTLTIKGKGGHGAHPEACVDPILAAHQVYAGIQGIQRSLGGREVYVISVCAMHAGTAFNIVPPAAELKGTVRTYDPATQDTIARRMREIARGVAAATGASIRLDYVKGIPATRNDGWLTGLAREAATAQGVPVSPSRQSLGAEDFAFFQQKVPGVYMDLGLCRGKPLAPLHNPRFDFDDRVLAVGSALLARCALRTLEAGRAR